MEGNGKNKDLLRSMTPYTEIVKLTFELEDFPFHVTMWKNVWNKRFVRYITYKIW